MDCAIQTVVLDKRLPYPRRMLEVGQLCENLQERLMIRLARKPDSIFSDLLDSAITQIVNDYLTSAHARDQEDWLCASMPRGARFFTASQAREQLLAIQKIYHDDRLYDVTKYHWLLLYECLETFAQGFNEQPVGWLAQKYGIEYIDFHRLVELFFWDTSFLMDHLARMSREETRTMLIWPESVGLAAGFKTHPDELSFIVCDEAVTKGFEEKVELPARSALSKSYPIS